MSRRISIDPVTRLEGHGRIEIFLDDAGEVANVFFQVPELRGFEQFCVGRLAEDMPVLTSRICGICPEAHHLAATKALDELFQVTPPPAARKLRELLYMAFFVADHTTHFYLLGGPDFIVGPDADPAQRNVLGVVAKLGDAAGRSVIECRARNHEVIKTLGGRGVNPVAGLPGGWSKPLAESDRGEIERAAAANFEFALASLRTFDDVVLGNPGYAEMLHSEAYTHRTYSMGTVDARNRANLYDGEIRIVDPDGRQLARYPCRDYDQHIAERTESWTYLKFPYLRAVGWKGFVDGQDSGVYCATPLSRLNVADGMSTPLAQQHFERFYETLGEGSLGGRQRPVHKRLATHWARLIELLHAAERMQELARDPEITSTQVRSIPSGAINPRGGVGSIEAPRGTLLHHYEADERGVLTRVNMIVGTTNNHAPIAMSLERAARSLIRGGEVIGQGLLNRIEMAFRLYDPCLSCATHALPGQMDLEVVLRDAAGAVLRRLTRATE
jgi:F420-non-reducing hydrogenase large subunit